MDLRLDDPALGNFLQQPRVPLGHAPTPLEAMKNLSAEIAGGQLWVKRDDCTGLAFGGNKVRQLEFYFGQALARKADHVLITGAVQSNFVRLAAAAAAQLGMTCHIQLEERVPGKGELYHQSGNVLLDRLLGAKLYSYPDGEDEAGADRRLSEIAAEIKNGGGRPYIIPLAPGHPPHGALGYVVAAAETLAQAKATGLKIDRYIIPSGSGATHAGFLFGLRALGDQTPVEGICVRRSAELQTPRIIKRCQEIADLLACDNPVTDGDVQITDRFLAPGYGQINPHSQEALRLSAQREALMLDPVYTAKCMAGAIHFARENPEETLLFLHTGGTPALFAYEGDLV